MRRILIALVLLMTVLTFYSALWFKSETIEQDITKRTTDELESSGATGVDVAVDGRHVTLSGVVYDEATETAYLDTADRAYGALGPIDGLTYLDDGGYISATKTSDGVTLRGTVPTEADRAELVAKAEAATGAMIDDQLVIGGVDAPWQDEADFGLAQLAGLSTGALTVAPDTYVLSGTTDGDVADVTSAVDGREGWNAFVSSPVAENTLESEVGRLNGVVMQRDATIADLTAERDGLDSELDGVRASLTADQAALRDELDAAGSMVAERDQTIADQQGIIDARQATMAEQATLIRDRDTTITDLNGRIGTLENDLEQRQVALGSTDEQVTTLRSQVDAQSGVIADLESNVTDLNGVIAQRDETIAGLETDMSDLTGLVAERDQTIAGFDTDVTRLTGLVAERDETIAGLQSDLDAERTEAAASDNDRIASLTGQVADRDATIADLNGTVDSLQGTVSTLEGDVADLRGQVNDSEGSLAATAAQIAALTAATQSNDAQTTALQGEVDDLTAVVAERDATLAERDATIEALRVPTAATPVASVAEQCAAQAASVMEGSRINFVTSSAQIEDGSVALLERITGIALACVDEGALSVEVGGHTDSDGTDENNQALSEARAQAVVDFMTARGVPAGGLNAVGYGESQPIADNSTAEGKAENRRISFDWQAR